MLPYSAAIDYAAYQSRSDGLSVPTSGYSWLVPSQDLCVANFKSNQQPPLQLDPGHVFFLSKL